MTDREKEIAEMAKDYDDIRAQSYRDYIPQSNMGIAYYFANALADMCYRKIPDGAVVLTREEYERLKSDRKIKVVQHLDDEYTVEIPQCEYDEMLEQARKETAREILKLLSDHGVGKEMIECFKMYDVNGIKIAKEICEKYGVEVE